jgi:hypothetical protein
MQFNKGCIQIHEDVIVDLLDNAVHVCHLHVPEIRPHWILEADIISGKNGKIKEYATYVGLHILSG